MHLENNSRCLLTCASQAICRVALPHQMWEAAAARLESTGVLGWRHQTDRYASWWGEMHIKKPSVWCVYQHSCAVSFSQMVPTQPRLLAGHKRGPKTNQRGAWTDYRQKQRARLCFTDRQSSGSDHFTDTADLDQQTNQSDKLPGKRCTLLKQWMTNKVLFC